MGVEKSERGTQAIASEVYHALKTGDRKRLDHLLPSEEDLLAFSVRSQRSAPYRMPLQLSEDLRTHPRYDKTQAAQTAAAMSQALERHASSVRETASKRGFTWEDAALVSVACRTCIHDEDTSPLPEGFKYGYVLLDISDGRRSARVRFYLFENGTIDSGIFIEDLSPRERCLLRDLAGWLWLGNRPPQSVGQALSVLRDHRLSKRELPEWLLTQPKAAQHDAKKWLFEGVGLDKRAVEIVFDETGRVERVLLDGAPIQTSQ